jgi:hypothetical protein
LLDPDVVSDFAALNSGNRDGQRSSMPSTCLLATARITEHLDETDVGIVLE